MIGFGDPAFDAAYDRWRLQTNGNMLKKSNMQNQARVKKGEKYWYIYDRFEVAFSIEDNSPISNKHFETNNYFHTKEEAESYARKLRAVLKGAEVIEIPSEDEMLGAIPIIDDPYDELGCGRRLGWRECYNWFKSKIVK